MNLLSDRAPTAPRRSVLLMVIALFALAPAPGNAQHYVDFDTAALVIPPPDGMTLADSDTATQLSLHLLPRRGIHVAPDQFYLGAPAPEMVDANDEGFPMNMAILSHAHATDGFDAKTLFDVPPLTLDFTAAAINTYLPTDIAGYSVSYARGHVFRQEKWGAFFIVNAQALSADRNDLKRLRIAMSFIKANDQVMRLMVITPAGPYGEQMNAESDLSAWADAIRQANPEPVSVHSGTTYRLAPLLILLALGGLAYRLFVPKRS